MSFGAAAAQAARPRAGPGTTPDRDYRHVHSRHFGIRRVHHNEKLRGDFAIENLFDKRHQKYPGSEQRELRVEARLALTDFRRGDR